MLAWYCASGSPGVELAGKVTLTPDPAHHQLTGTVQGDTYHVDLVIEYFPGSTALEITITLLQDGIPQDQYLVEIDAPQSEDPFDSGLLHFTDGIPGCNITARAWV